MSEIRLPTGAGVVPEQWFNVASAFTGAVEASVCATASWNDEIVGVDKERLYAYTPLLDHENGSIQIGTMMFKAGLINRKMEPRYYGPYEVLSYVGWRTVELNPKT